jgi:predicted transcriptional regulator
LTTIGKSCYKESVSSNSLKGTTLARKKSSTLTDAELRLMDVLWNKGPSNTTDVLKALPGDDKLAYTTVLTTLRILEDKGYVEHTKDGKAFVYHAVVDRASARRSALRHLVNRLFQNSPELLFSNLIADEKLTAKQLRGIKKMIEESE